MDRKIWHDKVEGYAWEEWRTILKKICTEHDQKAVVLNHSVSFAQDDAMVETIAWVPAMMTVTWIARLKARVLFIRSKKLGEKMKSCDQRHEDQCYEHTIVWETLLLTLSRLWSAWDFEELMLSRRESAEVTVLVEDQMEDMMWRARELGCPKICKPERHK